MRQSDKDTLTSKLDYKSYKYRLGKHLVKKYLNCSRKKCWNQGERAGERKTARETESVENKNAARKNHQHIWLNRVY